MYLITFLVHSLLICVKEISQHVFFFQVSILKRMIAAFLGLFLAVVVNALDTEYNFRLAISGQDSLGRFVYLNLHMVQPHIQHSNLNRYDHFMEYKHFIFRSTNGQVWIE